jgi:hypothetical protein
VGMDLHAKQKIVHIKSKMCRPVVPLPVFNSNASFSWRKESYLKQHRRIFYC